MQYAISWLVIIATVALLRTFAPHEESPYDYPKWLRRTITRVRER